MIDLVDSELLQEVLTLLWFFTIVDGEYRERIANTLDDLIGVVSMGMNEYGDEPDELAEEHRAFVDDAMRRIRGE